MYAFNQGLTSRTREVHGPLRSEVNQAKQTAYSIHIPFSADLPNINPVDAIGVHSCTVTRLWEVQY